MKLRMCNGLAVAAVLAFSPLFAQDNWPAWRGPSATGVSPAKALPSEWGPDKNIRWQVSLPSWSGATPIIWGDRIFITSPTAPDAESVRQHEEAPVPEGRRGRRGRGRHPGGDNLLLLCLDRNTGKTLWTGELGAGNRLHRKGNSASPSPVTDGRHVWVVTGTGTVDAFTMAGKHVWQANLQKAYGNFGLQWGYASSPLLLDGKLIIEVLHGRRTDDPSYIIAFEAASGKVLWRHERPTDAIAESPDAYTTPLAVLHEGRMQVVISGGDYVTGHDSGTGKELWRAGGLNPEKRRNYRVVASPVVLNDLILAPSRKTPMLALRTGGSGDITESHLVWKWTGGAAPDVPTPVAHNGAFYLVDDKGLVSSLDAKTGERRWGPERTAQGIVSASPVFADGKLFILNEKAITTVAEVEPAFRIVATNELDGKYTIASPAISGNNIFIRTAESLFCIGGSQGTN